MRKVSLCRETAPLLCRHVHIWDMLKKAPRAARYARRSGCGGVAAGAQKGIAITNKIYVICDGAAAFMAQVTMMQRINFGLIKKGVQIFDPTNTYIAPDADIAPGAVILPGCHIRPGCKGRRRRGHRPELHPRKGGDRRGHHGQQLAGL